MSDDAPVLYEVADGVATITLNRHEARNTLNVASMELLIAHLGRAAADDTVRVVVLTGAGSTFCAGADMREALGEHGFDEGPLRLLAEVMAALQDHPRPTIARVQGHVAGGGNGLVAACDLAVAADSAKFAFSEVRIGVSPAVIAVMCLPLMHPRDAAELLLTGERVSAERVREAGLVTRVVPADEVDATVVEWVRQLRSGGPIAVPATKRLIRDLRGLTRDEGFDHTIPMSAALFMSEEAREGMTAFLTKRPAAWVPAP